MVQADTLVILDFPQIILADQNAQRSIANRETCPVIGKCELGNFVERAETLTYEYHGHQNQSNNHIENKYE